MSSLNQCNFIGYVAADPEVRSTAGGDKVANFRIGCGESWKDKQSGERKEKTEWINCVAWRGLAEVIEDYCRKGMQVFVSGKFTTEKWKDKEGNDRYTTKILVDTFKMLGKKSDNENRDNTGRQQDRQQGGGGGSGSGSSASDQGGFDDDIPF